MIISVGNIAMGGTGKTPFTIYLAERYAKDDKKVCILSRGYKGKIGYDTNIISDGSNILYKPPLAADEAYMIATELLKYRVPVITGKNRNNSYSLGTDKFNSDIFILDDAFQHRKMYRDIDIVLMDYKNPISTGLPFPLGYLREFPKALERADIIVFTRSENTIVPEKTFKYIKGKNIFFCKHKYSNFFSKNNEIKTIQEVKSRKGILLSGIANHKQFRDQIEKLGINIIEEKVFRDHKAYSDAELKNIINLSNSNNSIIITTQKDFVKIPLELQENFVYPKIEIEMLNGDIIETINKMVLSKKGALES